MDREEAIKILQNPPRVYDEKMWEALDMAIEALKNKNEWIPVRWHEITEEEREREDYPKYWERYLDCEMPDDGEDILTMTKYGVIADIGYNDYEYYLESGRDWIDDVTAWMPFPEPYKE